MNERQRRAKAAWREYEDRQIMKANQLREKYAKVGLGNSPTVCELRLMRRWVPRKSWWQRFWEWSADDPRMDTA